MTAISERAQRRRTCAGFLVELLEAMMLLALISAFWPGTDAVFAALSSPASAFVLGEWIGLSAVLVVVADKADAWLSRRKASRKAHSP
jgi:hypothetical protein